MKTNIDLNLDNPTVIPKTTNVVDIDGPAVNSNTTNGFDIDDPTLKSKITVTQTPPFSNQNPNDEPTNINETI